MELGPIARLTAMLETLSFSQKAVVPRETHDYDFDRFAPSIQAENIEIFRPGRGRENIKIRVLGLTGNHSLLRKRRCLKHCSYPSNGTQFRALEKFHHKGMGN